MICFISYYFFVVTFDIFLYTNLMGVLITILCLSFVIFIHEMGHLLAAKWSGIGVSEFSVGMGPKVFGFLYGETRYNLRLFPLGGFVKLAGLDDSDNEFEEAVFFQSRPLFKRVVTISAGSIMNVLLGFVIFWGIVLIVGLPVTSTVIDTVVKDSPAYNVLQSGDTLTHINGAFIQDIRKDFIDVINDTQGGVTITFIRDNQELSRRITPYFDDDYQLYRLGIQLQSMNQRMYGFSSIIKAGELTLKCVSLLYLNIQYLVDGKAGISDLSGPIGIVQIASFQLSQDIVNFFNIMAFISITLGLMNLLPIPVLDGGHLMFLLYEAVFRKPASKTVMVVISNVFALFLIMLMAFVIVNDFRFWGERNNMMETMQEK